MTSPRRLVASRFPTRFLGPAVVALQRQWHAAALAEQPSSLTGVVVAARLGPLQEGELTLDVDGDHWTVEVGHPWRSERAGLLAEMMGKGRWLSVVGRCHADPSQRCLHAEQVVIDGRTFDLQLPGHS
jgi:hypothetical protein